MGHCLEGRVARVLHPGLPSHPQHELAMRQMDACGPIFAFEVADRAQAHGLLDALQLIDISNNLGDAKSLLTHPETTTHSKVSPEERAALGISAGMMRISVGLEDADDLCEDLEQALKVA